ncbi:MAG: hypothetical protein HOV80_04740 [Polyangiaceae bacterium]|nr:hypothetical protein [Polyangiaceae bacterium]
MSIRAMAPHDLLRGNASYYSRMRIALRLACLLTLLASCGDGDATTNECGSTEPEEGTDGTVPDDPQSEEIVRACRGFCQRLISNSLCYDSADACPLVEDDCIDDCRLQSCDVCPGTLTTFLNCQTKYFQASEWSCPDVSCPMPQCQQRHAELTMCGG